MLTLALISTAEAVLIVAALFFIPRWLFWITSHADSAYGVLSGQYGRRVTIWIMVITTVIFAAGIFLLQWSTR